MSLPSWAQFALNIFNNLLHFNFLIILVWVEFYTRKNIASRTLWLRLWILRSAIACTLLCGNFWLNVVCKFLLNIYRLLVSIWTCYCDIFLKSDCPCNSFIDHVFAVGPDEVVETAVFDLLRSNATHNFIPDIVVLLVDHRWPVLIVVELVVGHLLVLFLFNFDCSGKSNPLLFSQVVRVIGLAQCTLIIQQCPVRSLVFAPTFLLLSFYLSSCLYRFKEFHLRFTMLSGCSFQCLHRHYSMIDPLWLKILVHF